MQLKLGMPEILVIFSLFMYPQSFVFSVIAFCLGVFSRVGSYLIDYGKEMKKAEALTNSAEEIGDVFKDVLNGFAKN